MVKEVFIRQFQVPGANEFVSIPAARSLIESANLGLIREDDELDVMSCEKGR